MYPQIFLDKKTCLPFNWWREFTRIEFSEKKNHRVERNFPVLFEFKLRKLPGRDFELRRENMNVYGGIQGAREGHLNPPISHPSPPSCP